MDMGDGMQAVALNAIFFVQLRENLHVSCTSWWLHAGVGTLPNWLCLVRKSRAWQVALGQLPDVWSKWASSSNPDFWVCCWKAEWGYTLGYIGASPFWRLTLGIKSLSFTLIICLQYKKNWPLAAFMSNSSQNTANGYEVGSGTSQETSLWGAVDGSEDRDVFWRSWALQSALPPLCTSITAILKHLGHSARSPVLNTAGIDAGMCRTCVLQAGLAAGSWPSIIPKCYLMVAQQRGELILGTGHLY